MYMIKSGLMYLSLGLSLGLMVSLWSVRERTVKLCHNTGPFKCEVVNNNLVRLVGQTEKTQGWAILVALEKK